MWMSAASTLSMLCRRSRNLATVSSSMSPAYKSKRPTASSAIGRVSPHPWGNLVVLFFFVLFLFFLFFLFFFDLFFGFFLDLFFSLFGFFLGLFFSLFGFFLGL